MADANWGASSDLLKFAGNYLPKSFVPTRARNRTKEMRTYLLERRAATQCRSRDADQLEISANCFGLITVISGVISGNYALT